MSNCVATSAIDASSRHPGGDDAMALRDELLAFRDKFVANLLESLRKFDPNPIHDPKTGHFMSKPGAKGSRFNVDGSASGKGRGTAKRDPIKDFEHHVRNHYAKKGEMPYNIREAQVGQALSRVQSILADAKARVRDRMNPKASPAAPATPPAGPAPRETWQMSRDEHADAEYDKLVKDPSSYTADGKSKLGKKRFYDAIHGKQHKDAVRGAIVEGREIPDAVKADYPDLFPKPKKPAKAKAASAAPPAVEAKPAAPATTTPAPAAEPKPSSPAAAEAATPREAVAKEAKALDADYEFARASSVPNVGEDLKGSARHRVNAWRGLDQAEKDGSAAEFVTRDNLLKAEPHNLMSLADQSPLSALAMHYAIKALPAKPGYGNEGRRSRQDEATKVKDRREFLETYRDVRAKAEELAVKHANPNDALDEMRRFITTKIQDLRGVPEGSRGTYAGTYNMKDPYNNTANALTSTLKALATHARRPKTGVVESLGRFAKMVNEKYGPPDMTTVSKVKEHAKDVIEGRSLPQSFGIAGKSRDGDSKDVNPADMYVKVANRVGGTDVSAITGDPKTASERIVKAFGARGVQWGNSVTDDERKHHAAKLVESLADLADVTGMKPQDLSLDGKLGYAIGARGKGRALAHYEPSTKVINLTRKSGVGALAHEWGHAFDHSLTGFSGSQKPYMSEGVGFGTNEATYNAMIGVRRAMDESGFSRRLVAACRDRGMTPAKQQYWTSNVEKFARAFETFAQHKLRSQGRDNTYLSGISDSGRSDGGLWPNNEEIAKIAPAMESLFEAHREKKYGTKAPQTYTASDLKKAFESPDSVGVDSSLVASIVGELASAIRKYDPNPIHDARNGQFMAKAGARRSRYNANGTPSGRGSPAIAKRPRDPNRDFRSIATKYRQLPYKLRDTQSSEAKDRVYHTTTAATAAAKESIAAGPRPKTSGGYDAKRAADLKVMDATLSDIQSRGLKTRTGAKIPPEAWRRVTETMSELNVPHDAGGLHDLRNQMAYHVAEETRMKAKRDFAKAREHAMKRVATRAYHDQLRKKIVDQIVGGS